MTATQIREEINAIKAEADRMKQIERSMMLVPEVATSWDDLDDNSAFLFMDEIAEFQKSICTKDELQVIAWCAEKTMRDLLELITD